MYTEDDEKVKVKKSNSNNSDYNDFYSAFNNTEADHEEKKETKKEKKPDKKKATPPKKEKKVEKEEDEYSYFYTINDSAEFPQTDKKNLKKILMICGIAILAIILVVVSIIVIKGLTKQDIELLNNNISIKVGESDYISYKIVNNDVNNISSFTSSDNAVVTVDENGMVTGIGGGEATISFSYDVNGRTRTKKCKITVIGEPIGDDITMNVTYSSGSSDTWTNQDVRLSIETTGYVSSIRYAVNCTGECNYLEVVDKQIVITENGINNVKIVANGRNNKELVKDVVVKIDKEAPTAAISGNKNIVANGSVEVCATCSDSLSGCVNNKVCKKFTSSKANQVITVTDNAGNTANSSTFSVTINSSSEPCSLSVSSDGVVTAKVNGNASYYGFDSNYTGTNELSKKIDINATKNGDSFAKVVFYFVKNTNGSGGKCYITVIKECKCTDSSRNDASCPVTCTFRAS